MIETLRIHGYRSLEDVRLPLSPLTVVTGANGTGKSNLYRSLQLLARAARGELAKAIVEEGGMPSVLWSGQRRRTSRQPSRVQFSIAVQTDSFGYELECGLPIPRATLFRRDPDVKAERAWLGDKPRPSMLFLERDHASASLRAADGQRQDYAGNIESTETALAQIQDARRYPDVEVMRTHFLRWRFYHHFRVDPESPLRQPRQSTLTPSLASDAGDLAAALQTIREIGDAAALDAAIDRMQAGAQLEIVDIESNGWLDVRLHTPGLLRPLALRELSDGTVRYLALVAALLSPRPAPLLAFNEPESSLHPNLIAPLAALFVSAAQRSQIWVTTHSDALTHALAEASGHRPIRLQLEKGATRIVGQNLLEGV
ncbi:MAG TPA: AAA family ATPase [Opitutaceae bacterium]